ncbi:MAG: hypothetical protein RLZZ511_3553 [Cyanobacteriota bacterium]|jgi:hypothetical protein
MTRIICLRILWRPCDRVSGGDSTAFCQVVEKHLLTLSESVYTDSTKLIESIEAGRQLFLNN